MATVIDRKPGAMRRANVRSCEIGYGKVLSVSPKRIVTGRFGGICPSKRCVSIQSQAGK